MLALVEIIFTVKAWRKGWKAWALVPMATSLLLGALMACTLLTIRTQMPFVKLMVFWSIAEIAAIAALLRMNRRDQGPQDNPIDDPLTETMLSIQATPGFVW